ASAIDGACCRAKRRQGIRTLFSGGIADSQQLIKADANQVGRGGGAPFRRVKTRWRVDDLEYFPGGAWLSDADAAYQGYADPGAPRRGDRSRRGGEPDNAWQGAGQGRPARRWGRPGPTSGARGAGSRPPARTAGRTSRSAPTPYDPSSLRGTPSR